MRTLMDPGSREAGRARVEHTGDLPFDPVDVPEDNRVILVSRPDKKSAAPYSISIFAGNARAGRRG